MSADVLLAEAAEAPVVGSFVVDGLTFAVAGEGSVELVGVAPATTGEGSENGSPSVILSEGSEAAEVEESNESHASEAGATNATLPGTVLYEGAEYVLSSIGAYAFYLSGMTDVTLPASVSNVDDRAFRSSDVARVAVDADNPVYSSYDGALYSADMTSLLLIPEGRTGAVRVPSHAASVAPSVFSHCAGVDAIAVDAGCSHLSSENGLLYDAEGATLLRVPAGATEVTIREGCTAIAAGALEACAKLTTINAPATVAAISPDVFHAIPTVSLPVASAQHDEAADAVASGLPDQSNATAGSVALSESGDTAAPSVILGGGSEAAEVEESNEGQTSEVGSQLTAMVALSSTDSDLPVVTPSSITVLLPEESAAQIWHAMGFATIGGRSEHEAATEHAMSGKAGEVIGSVTFYVPEGYYMSGNAVASNNGQKLPVTSADGGSIRAFWGVPTYPETARVIAVGDGSEHGRSAGEFRTYFAIVGANTGWVDGYVFSSSSKEKIEDGAWFLDGEYSTRARSEYQVLHGDEIPSQLYWHPMVSTVSFDAQGGTVTPDSMVMRVDADMPSLAVWPKKAGHMLVGWFDDEGNQYYNADGSGVCRWDKMFDTTLYAQWKRVDYDLGFDVDSEPGDADCKGEPKDDQTVNVEDGPTAIEDPKRPGYVFQGWAIPSEDGTEAIDQDLVYQDETDGKWYVDASKLPDYAGDDGRVELTARWSAAVKVDAPLSATFYYDLTLPDGEGYWDEARDAAVEGAAGAAGTAAIRNHSAVPLRVAGMESATGKDSARLLKKGDEWVNDLPKGEASVLSVFPTKSASTGTEDAALGPSSASQDKGDDLAHAVTLALDEVKLEAAFDADAWAIGAATVGDNGVVAKTGDLRLGYRLDLGGEGGVTLDYDALLDATEGDEGKAASLTSIAYCFALQAPRPTGTRSDPLYVEVTDPEVGGVGVYGLADIKAAADDFSSRVDPATDPNDWASISSQIAGSPYAKLYTELLEGGACFKLKVDGAYLDAQLIGICQDARSDNGRRAGLTFQTKDVYAYNNKKSNAAGGGTFNTQMNPLDKNVGGWQAMPLRERLRTTFMNSLDGQLRTAIAPLRKSQQIFGDIGAASLQNTTGKEGETIWLPSRYELSGMIFDRYNESEAIGNSSYKPFQYHAFAGSNGLRLYNKYFNDSIPGWWTRSAYRSNRSIFCQVNGVDGRFSQNAAYAGGVAPCFAL